MESALVIGGTRFIGRHTVVELLDAGYEVTIFNRGTHENPFDAGRVRHVEGDRTDTGALEAAARTVDPDLVVDCVAYHPADVREATRVFADVEAYVYISSGDAYAEEVVPKREGETPLEPCSPSQATDDSAATYGPRKAAGDRAVFEAADRGIRAFVVRPCIVYGPFDYSERLDYWLHRVATTEAIVVPGDGQNLWHRAYVEDVARALRLVAERGEPGAAYNVGDRQVLTLRETVELIADVMDRDVEVIQASARELSVVGLEPDDFVLYRDYPHVFETSRLASIGWTSTPVRDAMARTVEEHLGSDRDGAEYDPGREAEQRLIDVLGTV